MEAFRLYQPSKFKSYRTIEAAKSHLLNAPRESDAELFYLKNVIELTDTPDKWIKFNLLLESRSDLLPLVGKIFTIETTENLNDFYLFKGIMSAPAALLEFYLKLIDEIYPETKIEFWKRLINPNHQALSIIAIHKIFSDKDAAIIEDCYLNHADYYTLINAIFAKTRSVDNLELIRVNSQAYFNQNALKLASELFFSYPHEVLEYFKLRKDLNQISEGRYFKVCTLINELDKKSKETEAVDKFGELIVQYRKTSEAEEKSAILEEICFRANELEDHLLLLDLAENNDFGLNFTKKIIDQALSRYQHEGSSLFAVYKKIKGKVIESYFTGSLFTLKVPFKTLDCLYLQNNDEDFSKIIFELMSSAAETAEHFLCLCHKNECDEDKERKFLTEIRKQKGGYGFWAKALRHAKEGSQLFACAEKSVKYYLSRKSFKELYKMYEEYQEDYLTPILLEALAVIAETEEEVDKLLYIAPRDGKVYIDALKKKDAF